MIADENSDLATHNENYGVDCETNAAERAMPKFSCMPLYRTYSHPSSGRISNTVVVVEIRPPSGIEPGMYDVTVADSGAVLQLECENPANLLDPIVFDGKWLPVTGDSSLDLNHSRITHSRKNAQDAIREYGSRRIKSTVHIILPESVKDDVESIHTSCLGFDDPSEMSVKANGLALQVRLLAEEEIPFSLFDEPSKSTFEEVNHSAAPPVPNTAGISLLNI